MAGKSLAMMPWFPRDFIAATRHLALAERGAYRELLDYQWEMGVLPKDPARLARLLAVTVEEFAPIWSAISDKFEELNGGLANKRLEEHRKKAVEQRDKKIAGANKTNANRNGQRDAERSAKRDDIGSPPSPSPSPSLCRVENAREELTEAGRMARALIPLGVSVTSIHPTLIGWVQSGFTIEQLSEAVQIAKNNGKESIPPNYLDKIIRQPARPPPIPQHERGAWRPEPDEAA